MIPRLLFVQDEREILERYERSLEKEGFEVVGATGADEALQRALDVNPDVVVADISLPGMDAFALAKKIKGDPRTAHIPVILVSAARKAARERASLIKEVADDFILEPSSHLILKARINAVLRRARVPTEAGQILSTLGLRLDVRAREVSVKGRPVQLTRKEFDLLTLFLTRKGTVLSIQKLLEDVWGYDGGYDDPRTVQTHVSSLRRKLGTPVAERILTFSGIGYRFD